MNDDDIRRLLDDAVPVPPRRLSSDELVLGARRRHRRLRTGRQSALAVAAVGATALAVVAPSTFLADSTPSSSDRLTGSGPARGAVTAPDRPTVSCRYTPAGEAARPVTAPPADLPVPATRTATIGLSGGTVVVRLLAPDAPCTVRSLEHLAAQGFYDGTSCHRVTTRGIFVLQCGDPTGLGDRGPGYTYTDENLAGATYPAGTVAMANAGPGTNGSQFFFVYRDTLLPPNYTPFGVVTAGLSVVEQIAAQGADGRNGAGDGRPRAAADIRSVTTS